MRRQFVGRRSRGEIDVALEVLSTWPRTQTLVGRATKALLASISNGWFRLWRSQITSLVSGISRFETER